MASGPSKSCRSYLTQFRLVPLLTRPSAASELGLATLGPQERTVCVAVALYSLVCSVCQHACLLLRQCIQMRRHISTGVQETPESRQRRQPVLLSTEQQERPDQAPRSKTPAKKRPRPDSAKPKLDGSSAAPARHSLKGAAAQQDNIGKALIASKEGEPWRSINDMACTRRDDLALKHFLQKLFKGKGNVHHACSAVSAQLLCMHNDCGNEAFNTMSPCRQS